MTNKRKMALVAAVGLLIGANLNAQESISLSMRRTVVSPEIGKDAITFRLNAPQAQTVNIAASWLGHDPSKGAMSKDESGIWSITLPLPSPELYTYTFIVDGVSTLDPSNVFVSRDGSRYTNGLLISGGVADEYKESDKPGNVEHAWYYSAENDMTRRLYVYTPYGYDKKDTRKKYPVLYLLHGGGGDEDAWSTLGRTCQILDNLIAAGKAEPMLVVMPNGNPSQYAAQTLLIPEKTIKTKYNSGFDNYTSLVSDIIPFIEKNYNVIADREHRSVAGLSMGGGQSFYVAFRNVDLFSSVGIFSSGLIGSSAIGGTPFNAEEQIPGMLSMPAAFNRFDVIYLSCGEQDGRIDGMKEFNDTLKSKGYKGVVWETFEGGHEWKVWRRSLSSYAQKIFK